MDLKNPGGIQGKGPGVVLGRTGGSHSRGRRVGGFAMGLCQTVKIKQAFVNVFGKVDSHVESQTVVSPAERGQWCWGCGRDCRGRLESDGFRKEGFGLISEEGIICSTIIKGLEGWWRCFRDGGAMVSSCGRAMEKGVSMVAKATKRINSEGEQHDVLEK